MTSLFNNSWLNDSFEGRMDSVQGHHFVWKTGDVREFNSSHEWPKSLCSVEENLIGKNLFTFGAMPLCTLEFCTWLELQPRSHPLPEHLFLSPPHPRTSNSQARPIPSCCLYNSVPVPIPAMFTTVPIPNPTLFDKLAKCHQWVGHHLIIIKEISWKL